MSVYTDNGYKDRKDYLKSLSEDYAIPLEYVLVMADLLGSNEDFDGLISGLKDIESLWPEGFF